MINRNPACDGEIAGVFQELKAVAALPSRIRVGEVHSYITGGDSAQNGIRYGMRKNIRVGVPLQPKVGRDGNAAENQRPPGSDAMNVPALADTQ